MEDSFTSGYSANTQKITKTITPLNSAKPIKHISIYDATLNNVDIATSITSTYNNDGSATITFYVWNRTVSITSLITFLVVE